MRNYPLAILLLCGLNSISFADSTSVLVPKPKPVLHTFLLAHGEISAGEGDSRVLRPSTSLRCPSLTFPKLATSVKIIEVWGGYAIKGVNNNLELNPRTYMISGEINAPIAGIGNPNNVTLNWKIWCEPNQSV